MKTKRMTYKQFISKLSKTPRKWVLTPGGMIRQSTHDSRTLDVCPITSLTCPIMTADKFEYAAQKLGIRKSVAWRIMQAADRRAAAPDSDTWDRKLRADLLKACGLL